MTIVSESPSQLRDTARAMSQENVELVRRGFEAWSAGDMEAYRELLDPDVIWRPPEGVPEQEPFVGREAVTRGIEQFREAWDNADVAEPISDFIDAGDRVVVRFVWRGEGRGPEADTEMSCVYTVRNGKHLAFDFFWNHAEALEAAGLRE